MTRVWLDDLRDPRLGVAQMKGADGSEVWVTTAEDAIALVLAGGVTWLSLDNDLGGGMTEGRKVADWIEVAAHSGTIGPIELHAHTDNPVARRAMLAAFASARRAWERR